MTATDSALHHLDAADLAAFVDGDRQSRARLTVHLAECPECRAEITEVAALVRTAPVSGRWQSGISWRLASLAAAAVIVLVARPWTPGNDAARTREGVVATIVAPRALAPEGSQDSVGSLAWSVVPLAFDYRVRLFDGKGRVMWQHETRDTIAFLPDSIVLRAGAAYFWRVEARTGYGRRTASELVEFMIQPPAGG